MGSPGTLFQNALLAQAVYGDFEIDNGALAYSKEAVEDGIKVAGKGEFTAKQAETFAGQQGYTLISFTSDPSTGFEAALFESRTEPGKYTLAIRGTSGLLDIVGADIFGIAFQGQASAQSLSLYRYYKRLITPRGAAVEYAQAEIELLATVTNRKYDGYGIALLRNSRDYQATAAGLALQLQDDKGLGRLDPGATIDVTGHSLGGHLAQLFGALFFPERVDHIYTYNGAGLGGALYKAGKKILAERGVNLAAGSINTVAEEGLTLTAGLGYKFGSTQQLAIEQGVLTDNHSIVNTADSLALYALLGQISPDLTLDNFNKIIRAAANEAKTGYEATLDILRRVFLGPDIQATQHSFRDDLAGRDEFYENIDVLKNSAAFKAFVGASGRQYSVAALVGTLNPAGLAEDDTDGIAYRYALKQLNPFALVGLDYAQFNQHGELALYNSATGEGAVTREWLQDRAQFLLWKNQKNLKDIADGALLLRSDNGIDSIRYTDKTLKDAQEQDYSILVAGSSLPGRLDPIHISFASDRGDTLQGGNDADHLYGGGGADTLVAGGGDDYLEGGAGGDELRGDTGDDTLIGGRGADTLIGGAGNDTYLIRAGDGRDAIVDHEGRNTIVYLDSNGKRLVLGVPAFAIGEQSNTWTGHLASGEPVTFTRNSPLTASFPDGTQVAIDDYQDGEYGIQLRIIPTHEPAPRFIFGDAEVAHFDSLFDEHGVEYYWTSREDEFGIVIRDPGRPMPDNPDTLVGAIGNDLISGLGGDDWLYGRDGADQIRGGAGVDRIYGEEGDDLIEGQDGSFPDEYVNYLDGGAGDDTLYATVERDIQGAIAAANDTGLEVPGSRINGGPGDDIIVGSKGADIIAGGEGGDVLIGGGGADWIFGDFELTSQWEPLIVQYSGADADSADAIYGGSGNDVIRAGLGDDYVDGGDGDDQIVGESGSDVIVGGAGDDHIFAANGDYSFEASDDYIDGGDGNDYIEGSAGDNILLGGAGDDQILGQVGNDFIDGGDGDDILQGNEVHGGAGDDMVGGTPGADKLYGDDGNDTILGAGLPWSYTDSTGFLTSTYEMGDDWLYGGNGDDTYYFMLGGGIAHIIDDAGFSHIGLASYEDTMPDFGNANPYGPVARDSIHLELQDGSYWLVYGDAGDRVDLGAVVSETTLDLSLQHIRLGVQFDEDSDPDHLYPQPSSETTIEVIPWSDIAVSQSTAPEGGTLIAVEGLSNTLIGKESNDIILGASREDVLAGGAGDDFLDGGDGGDRYVFSPGDGVDVISDSGVQGDDTLAFGAGITAEALSLGIGSLLLRIGDSGDVIHIDGFDADDATAAGAIERFEFADGTVLSLAQLLSRGFDLYGTDAADTIFGTSVVDRFRASAGDDTLIGGAGDDVYYFGAGSGRDFIIDLDTTPNNLDTVVLGGGIAPENLVIQTSPGVLTLAVNGTEDRLAIQWQAQAGYAIESVQFADGTIWDGTMLESLAVPAPVTDIGSEPVEAEAEPPIEPEPTTVVIIAPAESGSGSISEVEAILSEEVTPEVVAIAPLADVGSATGEGGTEPPIAPESATAVTVTPAESKSDLTSEVGALTSEVGTPGRIAATPPASGPAVSSDSSSSPSAADATPARDGPIDGATQAIGIGGGAVLPNSQPDAIQISKDAPLASLHTIGAFDSAIADAGEPLRNSAKPTGIAGVQIAAEQTAPNRDPASFFAALQAPRPNMQTWLDNWLGPGARASAGSLEQRSVPLTEDELSSSEQELKPPDPAGELPQAEPEAEAEADLTPEEIAQSYDEIRAWLDAHPGVGDGSAGAGGAPPEKNPFVYAGSGLANGGATAPMAAFGLSPGMAAIGGHALQPLRGINEGYLPLGLA